MAARRRDGQTGWRSRPDHRQRARRTDGAGLSLVPAVQAAPRARGVRVPRRRLSRLDRLRARVPACQPRGVGPRGRPRCHRCSTMGDRAAVVRWAAGRLRRLVRRVPGAVGARRGALDVAGRRRPVWRLGDRRELPPRRPARAARAPEDDGLAGRPGAGRAVPPRIPGLPRRADRGPAAHPARAPGPDGSSR